MLQNKYAIDWIKGLELSLYLHNPGYDSKDVGKLHFYYHFTHSDMDIMTNWVLENNLGEQTSHLRWKFCDESALSYFIIKWIQ